MARRGWVGPAIAGVLWCGPAAVAGAAPVEVAKLPLPGAPFDGIAVTPDGKKLYVSLVAAKAPGKNTIAVIDTQTDTVAKVIDLGDQGADNSSPRQLFMAPDGSLLVHATYAGNLVVVDPASDTVVDSLPGVGKAVAVYTPDAKQLWSRDSSTKSLRVFDTADMSELAVLPLLSPGSSDFPLVITPDGARVYGVTSNEGGNPFPEPQAVTSFDVAALKQLKNYGVGAGFLGNAGTDARVSPDGKFLYTGGSNSTKLVKIDLATDTTALDVDVPQYGEGLALSPDGATLYAFENGYNSGKLRVFAADTLTLQQTLDMTGQVARFLATSRKTPFSPSGCAVIVPGPLKNQIFALDPQTHAKIATFDTPAGTAYTVEFLPNSTRAYLPWRTGATTGSLTILDLGEDCALAPDGAPCVGDDACTSGSCVDGVCCDSACGGGATDDCQACSTAQGGLVDGVCGPVGAGALCRPAADGTCDAPEQCDGLALECPPDAPKADGEPCDGGSCLAGVCEPDPVDSTGTTGDGTTGDGTTGDGTTASETATTGDGTTTGAPSTTGEPVTTTVGSASDSASASGEPTTTAPGATTATSGDTTGADLDSDASSAGEIVVTDGCGCASGDARGGWLGAALLLLLAPRRRRGSR